MFGHIMLLALAHEIDALVRGLVGTAAFGLVGIILMVIGFKLFELVTRRLDIEKQLEDKNIAVGIVVAALLLGTSLIVVVSMM